jgi:hypothetical protein
MQNLKIKVKNDNAKIKIITARYVAVVIPAKAGIHEISLDVNFTVKILKTN